MNPKKEIEFDELQLKLGIKSSLPNVKAALALLLAMWESGISDDGFVYGEESGDKIIPVEMVCDKLALYFSCDKHQLISKISINPLYTSQMEALQVAFELGWRLAKFTFVDQSFPFSKERTGGKRYAKKISYTKNIDIVSLYIQQDADNKMILYHWIMQRNVPIELATKESNLKRVLTALSEECVFRIRTNEDGTYTFRNYGIYDALLEEEEVNTADIKEQVGTLRILNSIINDDLNYYFEKKSNGTVGIRTGIDRDVMERYSIRVQNFLSLSDIKINISESEMESKPDELVLTTSKCTFDTTKGGANNRVVYGTPGCGKSYYVQNKYLSQCGVSKEHRIRTTFYMDYTNTDFVGQILPKVHEDGDKRTVTYDFNPGPFALALKMAIENPNEAVALIIEELNRGNAASIFGDIFQLLDRDKNGKSQYSITNTNLQDYLNKCFDGTYTFDSIQIPANLYIVATMNTSDQNVFTLDTAFKRRWQFEKLRNIFAADHQYKGYYIPGMKDVTWEKLVNSINKFIVNRPDDLSSEDKQLGVYFIDESTLCATKEECNNAEKIEKFAYKLFEYLWDDVAKFAHPDWFGADIKTLDQLIDRYKTIGEKVFVEGVIE